VALEAIEEAGFPAEAEAIGEVRRGQVERDPGFDGQYGSIRLTGTGKPSLSTLP
jgi:PHP family Zn ribbon phosphoesterase